MGNNTKLITLAALLATTTTTTSTASSSSNNKAIVDQQTTMEDSNKKKLYNNNNNNDRKIQQQQSSSSSNNNNKNYNNKKERKLNSKNGKATEEEDLSSADDVSTSQLELPYPNPPLWGQPPPPPPPLWGNPPPQIHGEWPPPSIHGEWPPPPPPPPPQWNVQPPPQWSVEPSTPSGKSGKSGVHTGPHPKPPPVSWEQHPPVSWGSEWHTSSGKSGKSGLTTPESSWWSSPPHPMPHEVEGWGSSTKSNKESNWWSPPPSWEHEEEEGSWLQWGGKATKHHKSSKSKSAKSMLWNEGSGGWWMSSDESHPTPPDVEEDEEDWWGDDAFFHDNTNSTTSSSSTNSCSLPDAKTIADIAIEAGIFTSLVEAAISAELVDALTNEDSSLTVFAPTDEAFAKLPEGTVENLSKEDLTSILKYHLVDGNVLSSDLVTSNVPTLNDDGATIQVVVDEQGGSIKLNDEVNVVTPFDVTACNGIVHSIDTVLMPPAPKEERTSASGSSSWHSSPQTVGGWWAAAGSKTSKNTKASYDSWQKPSPPKPQPSQQWMAHHMWPKSGKAVKAAKDHKSGKGEMMWWGGSASHDSAWGGSGDEEMIMGDDWWSSPTSDNNHCPPGKAGKDCNMDKGEPTVAPTPCGKAGKECGDDDLDDTQEAPDDTTYSASSVVESVSDTPVVATPNEDNESSPPERIGDLIPITAQPVSSPPSSGWPTWTPTSTPISTLEELAAGGTWFQSGRAYDVEMSHYRATNLANGVVHSDGSGEEEKMTSSAGSRLMMLSGCIMLLSGASIVMAYLA